MINGHTVRFLRSSDMSNYYCEKCDKRVPSGIEEREETLHVRGDAITVISKVRVCKVCGGICYDEELDSKTLANAFDIYRKKNNIISPDEIKKLREKYGLSQRSLASLLGWGVVTIHRYEQGAVPDEAHNTVLRTIADPERFKEIFEQRRDRLNEIARKRVERMLEGQSEQSDESVNPLFDVIQSNQPKPGILTGFKRFSTEALREMILFFASLDEGVFKTKLNKLLFYSDFIHYKLHTVSISGVSYAHLPYGPAPDQYQSFIGALEAESSIEIEEVDIGERLVCRTEPDYSVLPETAIPVLKAVYEFFKNSSSRQVSELSHKEPGWKETKDGQAISYEYADSLNVDIQIKD